MIADADPRECRYSPPCGESREAAERDVAIEEGPVMKAGSNPGSREVTITNPEKIFWPVEGYTKADLVNYYEGIARWMLPYLKDRPVMIVRYPDGIEGKSFYQKDAPDFAPEWIRTEKIYSEDSHREIAYFVIESAEA